jgi:hypothetical protein
VPKEKFPDGAATAARHFVGAYIKCALRLRLRRSKGSLLRLVLFSIISTRPGDLYAIQDDLGFIKLQIAGLPTRERGLARRDAAARAPP